MQRIPSVLHAPAGLVTLDQLEAPAHVAETKKPASRSKKAAADDLPTEPKKTVKVEGEDAETKKPAPTVVDVDADADYAGALDDLDFDD